MKRQIVLIIACAMLFSLCACGGNSTETSAETTEAVSEEPAAESAEDTVEESAEAVEEAPAEEETSEEAAEETIAEEPEAEPVEEEVLYHLGDTVSTDLADFTLDAATFSYYASALSTTYCEPIEEDDGGIFVASIGHVLVPLTFTINNKDRTHLDVAENFSGGWTFDFTVIYNGEEYPLNTYDLNDKDGSNYLTLRYSATSLDGGETFEQHSYSNELQDPGLETYRTLGIITTDPESLNNSFELRVNVITVSGDYEYFTYVIE